MTFPFIKYKRTESVWISRPYIGKRQILPECTTLINGGQMQYLLFVWWFRDGAKFRSLQTPIHADILIGKHIGLMLDTWYKKILILKSMKTMRLYTFDIIFTNLLNGTSLKISVIRIVLNSFKAFLPWHASFHPFFFSRRLLRTIGGDAQFFYYYYYLIHLV